MIRLPINTIEGLWLLNPKKIRDIEAARQYAKFYLTNGESLTFTGTLKSFMKRLASTGKFLRIHASHAVNKHEILRVEPRHIYLNDGTTLPLAKKYRAEVLALFELL